MTHPANEPTAESVRALLRHFAWRRSSSAGGQYELWSVDGARVEGAEILVPTDPGRGDYDELLRRASAHLLRMHGGAAERFITELEIKQSGVLDSTRWKKETAVPAGLIPWSDGRTLYESAQLQLVAVAKASREPRPYHGNASSYIAKRFLEQSFMGQTEIGSFVITALTPAQARIHLTKHSEDSSLTHPREVETVSGRSILSTFVSALEAVRSGLDEFVRSPRDEIFVERVDAGVSHELVKALAAFTANSESAVQVEFEALGAEQGKTIEFDFKPAESGVLERASSALAQDPEPRAVTLVGEVTLLSRDYDQAERVIRLVVASGLPVRRARVRLTAEQYEVALRAHHDEKSIQVSGSLEREGKLYWLYGASALSIVDADGGSRSRRSEMTVDVPLEFDDDTD